MYIMRNGNFLKLHVGEICVKQILNDLFTFVHTDCLATILQYYVSVLDLDFTLAFERLNEA